MGLSRIFGHRLGPPRVPPLSLGTTVLVVEGFTGLLRFSSLPNVDSEDRGNDNQ